MANGSIITPNLPKKVTSFNEVYELFNLNHNIPITVSWESISSSDKLVEITTVTTCQYCFIYWAAADEVLFKCFTTDKRISVRYNPQTDTVTSIRYIFSNKDQVLIENKTYSYQFTQADIDASASDADRLVKNLTLSDFGISAKTGYICLGVRRCSTGSSLNMLTGFRMDWSESALAEGTGTVMNMMNIGTKNDDAVTARLYVAWYKKA